MLIPALRLYGQGALAPNLPPAFAGAPNGFLCTTATGTMTPLATFSDPQQTTPLPNPIRLNAQGIPQTNTGASTAIYIQRRNYRFTLFAAGTANRCNGQPVGTQIWQRDNVFDYGQAAAGGYLPPELPLTLGPCSLNAGALPAVEIPPCISAMGGEAYPQWWGGKPDGTTESSAAINAAIQACSGTSATCSVRLTNGTWIIQSPILMYDPVTPRGIWGLQLCGRSKEATVLSWQGPATMSAIRMIGHSQKLCDLRILSSATGGWLDGIQYDGDPGIGISSAGKIADVMIECGNHPGNGVSFGRTRYQADQVLADHLYVTACVSGWGVMNMDANAVSNVVVSPSINHCWIGVGASVPTASLVVFGGEFDNNDVNFLPSPGTNLTVSGVRTEGSKRTIDTSVGSFPQPVYFTNYLLSSTYWDEAQRQGLPPRPPATGTVGADLSSVTLSNPSVTWGDFIVIAGAGPGGADLHTHVQAMTDPLHFTLDVAAAASAVSNAAVSLDLTRDQYNFYFEGGGPYVVSASYLNVMTAETAFSVPQGTLFLSGVGFIRTFPNANPLNTAGTLPDNVTWTGLWNGTVQNRMPDHFNLGGALSRLVCPTYSTLDVAIQTVYDMLPNGGTIDCSGRSGPQTLLVDPFAAMTRPITIILPPFAITLAVPINVPPNVLVQYTGGVNIDIQSTTTACTTAAAPGATCTVTVTDNFGSANRDTLCSFRDTPQANTGFPVVLKVAAAGANSFTATIGTFDGQAAGGGTMVCATNLAH